MHNIHVYIKWTYKKQIFHNYYFQIVVENFCDVKPM